MLKKVNVMNDSSLKLDFTAGFSVALVALPLSIGIALASGAPASAGLIAAIIGGLLGSWMGGTNVTINGPAAGLIVIVLDAVSGLGFKGMLGAAVVAGGIQIIMGLLKFARKGLAFPVSVIHGMMAAIGVIIIAKQTHIMIGHIPVAKNPLMLLAELPLSFGNIQLTVFAVGILTLCLLIFWNKITNPTIKKIPGPLVAVIFSAGLASYLGINSSALLQVPADIRSWIIVPDFSAVNSFPFWKSALTLAVVGALETTLSAAAIDKIDPKKRKSNLDRDLISKGICNTLSAAIGGLPMIAEIVRSSANVTYGAKTWRANFSHGFIILLAVLVLPKALSLIPLSALATILVMIGWRLGSPTHFRHAMKVGKDNLLGFTVTLVMTLAVDLLVGIFCGAVAQFAIEIYLGLKLKHSLKASYEIRTTPEMTEIIVHSSLAFSNFTGLKDAILKNAQIRKKINLDLTMCDYIDHSVMEQIEEIKEHFKFIKTPLTVNISAQQHSLGKDLLSARKKV